MLNFERRLKEDVFVVQLPMIFFVTTLESQNRW